MSTNNRTSWQHDPFGLPHGWLVFQRPGGRLPVTIRASSVGALVPTSSAEIVKIIYTIGDPQEWEVLCPGRSALIAIENAIEREREAERLALAEVIAKRLEGLRVDAGVAPEFLR